MEEFLHSYGRLGTVLNHALVSLVDSKSTSDSTILYDILNLVNKIRQNRDIVIWCILILTAFGSLFYKIFVANMLRVGECRFFLESRKYRDTKISKILFLYRHRIFKEPAKIMFFRWLYNGLWYLTIVGGIIKAYEYRMIPYIIAENHEVTRAEAFALSKEMMRGQKWKAFMLDVSFLGWEILSILTFGLVGIFYLNSYMMAADTELYSFLRAKAIEEKYLYYEVLNDLYL